MDDDHPNLAILRQWQAQAPKKTWSEPGSNTQVSACEGKVGHPTKDAALCSIKIMSRRKEYKPMHAYECEHCHKWHIGLQKKKPRIIKERK
jgi:hypothetical protein